ncbi:MAG: DUF6600 domain-containing protein [Candidatus Acidiferrales bacterium]
MKKQISVFAAAFLLAMVGSARAQDAPPQQYDQTVQSSQDSQDAQVPPADDQQGEGESEQATDTAQGVARVSQVQGDVSSQRGDNGQWVAVTVNTPISQDDRVSTGEKSRAELQLDFADILRLSDRSTARVAALNRKQIQVQVGQGLVTYNVLKGSEAQSEIDTPNSSIRPLGGEGEFRVLVNSDAETKVIVRRGSADISTSQGSTRVDAGQMITIAGTDNPQYQVSTALDRDDWDRWNSDRNRTIRDAGSWNNTNRYYTGTEDLDNHGVWTEVPDYGRVWVPAQDPGWAPYRAGRWVYQPYYGWTWVSYEPWGWAPYHYGRWFVYGGGWAWWPGPVAVYPAYYPIWSPAYVSFFGWGGGGWGVGVGFGFGGGFGRVGWLPIGPCDRFHPWWGRGGGRVNVVNVTNIRNTTNIRDGWRPLAGNRGHQYSNLNDAFRNQRVRSGISSMDGNKFGREAVPGHQRGVNEASFRQASLMTGKMPVNPSRESFNSTSKAPGASSVRNAPASSQRFFSPASRNSTAVAANREARASGANSSIRTNTSVSARSNIGSNRAPGNATTPSRNAPLPGPARMAGSVRGGSSVNRPQTDTPSGRMFAPPQQHTQNNQSSQSARPGGWQHFTPPPSRGTQPARPGQPTRAYQPPPSSSRGGYAGVYSRPPLNMNKPIVQPRGGYPNASRGGYPNTSRGNYPGGARGPYPSAPGGVYRGGSAGPAPRMPSTPSAPSRSSSAPRGYSGGNSGGSSRGNSGGGSHGSGGGSSHSSGGGSSHSSGGGSSHSGGRPH